MLYQHFFFSGLQTRQALFYLRIFANAAPCTRNASPSLHMYPLVNLYLSIWRQLKCPTLKMAFLQHSHPQIKFMSPLLFFFSMVLLGGCVMVCISPPNILLDCRLHGHRVFSVAFTCEYSVSLIFMSSINDF